MFYTQNKVYYNHEQLNCEISCCYGNNTKYLVTKGACDPIQTGCVRSDQDDHLNHVVYKWHAHCFKFNLLIDKNFVYMPTSLSSYSVCQIYVCVPHRLKLLNIQLTPLQRIFSIKICKPELSSRNSSSLPNSCYVVVIRKWERWWKTH